MVFPAVGAVAYDWLERVLVPATGSVGTGLLEMDIKGQGPEVISVLGSLRVTTLSKTISQAGTPTGSV